MLSFEDIQSKCKTTEKTVEIDAWGGEVKIRQLSVSESADVIATQSRGDGAMAMVKTAAYALVEPKMTVKKILALPQDAFDGLREIVEALGEMDEPKK